MNDQDIKILNEMKDRAMLLDKDRFLKEDKDPKTHPIRVSFVYELKTNQWLVHYDLANDKMSSLVTRVERPV